MVTVIFDTRTFFKKHKPERSHQMNYFGPSRDSPFVYEQKNLICLGRIVKCCVLKCRKVSLTGSQLRPCSGHQNPHLLINLIAKLGEVLESYPNNLNVFLHFLRAVTCCRFTQHSTVTYRISCSVHFSRQSNGYLNSIATYGLA